MGSFGSEVIGTWLRTSIWSSAKRSIFQPQNAKESTRHPYSGQSAVTIFINISFYFSYKDVERTLTLDESIQHKITPVLARNEHAEFSIFIKSLDPLWVPCLYVCHLNLFPDFQIFGAKKKKN